jgi:P pilus assembly chaperone PapD
MLGMALTASAASWATGMIPESSVVILEESDGETSMNVTNTDSSPMLLTTAIKPIDGDSEKLLLVSPPAIRVEGGKVQKVRFMLSSKTPLKTERLRRVVFSGIPPQNKGKNEVRMSVSQNLPVLIRPAGLARDDAPWKRLSWKMNGGSLTVSNDSPYVVRLAQGVQTLPDNGQWMLPQSYILPGEHITLQTKDGKKGGAAQQVRISPATTWGYSVDTFDAPLAK